MDFPPPAISIPPLYIKPALSSTSPLPSWQRYPIPKDLIGAPSLFQLCSKILIKYIDEVDDVGDMQYRTVKHIITKVTDPSKLKSIEHKCPQIAGECGDLWKKFIKRDFRADPEKYLPKDETLWYKVYAKHAKEFDAANRAAEEALLAQYSQLNAEKSKHLPNLLTGRAASESLRLVNVKHSGWSRSSWDSNDGWNSNPGSRTKAIFKKIKREVGGNKKKLTVPTHMLKPRSRISNEVVNKLKAGAAPVSVPLSTPRVENISRETETEKRFRLETSKKLGPKTAGKDIMNLDLRPYEPPKISKAPPPLPKTAAGLGAGLNGSKLRRAMAASAAGLGPEKFSPAKPSGVTKSVAPPKQAPVQAAAAASSTTARSQPCSAGSTFLDRLKMIATNPPEPLKPGPKPLIEKQQLPPPLLRASTSSGVPALKGVFVRPKREPTLFHVRKPVKKTS